MSKVMMISNRLPVTVKRQDGQFEYSWSIGGLATGLRSYHDRSDGLWIGWSGIINEEISQAENELIRQDLYDNYRCLAVSLSRAEIDNYYNGFCNKTIWPLFHYFPTKTEYNVNDWNAYQAVNQKFFDAVDPLISAGDTIWIHDYQLMLLPKMIKEKHPDTRIAFFLHIPFPSYEIYRLLVWREEILQGLLGADLIGFHTYNYVRHFLSSVRRLLGLEHNFYRLRYENRLVQVDAFPMGIDYERFANGSGNQDFFSEVKEIYDSNEDVKNILAIDRLDYTKGIPERIKAFDLFLERYPEYIQKVRLTLIVAPSRVEVEEYDKLKKEVFELVSGVNGRYGTINWMPIWIHYQTFPQEKLIALYKNSDVLLVTPLRDGMNLVAKEYIATRTDLQGMLVISETAGAASELGEAVIVNPNDIQAIAEGIKYALEMPVGDKIAVNRVIHERLKTYTVDYWADDILQALDNAVMSSFNTTSQNIENQYRLLEQSYLKAGRRLLLLDYDGTLVGFKPIPEQAKPDPELKSLLSKLSDDPLNTIVIISGRDRNILDEWLGDLNLHFVAAHGLWVRGPDRKWAMTVSLDNYWKKSVRNILEMYNSRMPGSLIEEKEYSLAFHYRQCEPDMVALRISEIKDALMFLTQATTLGIQEGNKVIEIKDNRVNKGYVASLFIQNDHYDFIFGVGDDLTDEDLFLVLPVDAFSIKVGVEETNANYYIKSWQSIRSILQRFTALSGTALFSNMRRHI